MDLDVLVKEQNIYGETCFFFGHVYWNPIEESQYTGEYYRDSISKDLLFKGGEELEYHMEATLLYYEYFKHIEDGLEYIISNLGHAFEEKETIRFLHDLGGLIEYIPFHKSCKEAICAMPKDANYYICQLGWEE